MPVPVALVTDLGVSAADQLQLLGLLLLAATLGALIGVEREVANKAAGARTHMLVASGAALAAAVGHVLISPDGSGDPARALHAVLTGIGFLGAGAIIRHETGGTVEGLTTAASVWFAAAIGITAGLGLMFLATGATLLALVILRVVRWALDRWDPREQAGGT